MGVVLELVGADGVFDLAEVLGVLESGFEGFDAGVVGGRGDVGSAVGAVNGFAEELSGGEEGYVAVRAGDGRGFGVGEDGIAMRVEGAVGGRVELRDVDGGMAVGAIDGEAGGGIADDEVFAAL